MKSRDALRRVQGKKAALFPKECKTHAISWSDEETANRCRVGEWRLAGKGQLLNESRFCCWCRLGPVSWWHAAPWSKQAAVPAQQAALGFSKRAQDKTKQSQMPIRSTKWKNSGVSLSCASFMGALALRVGKERLCVQTRAHSWGLALCSFLWNCHQGRLVGWCSQETQVSTLIPPLLERTAVYCLVFLKWYFEYSGSKSQRHS